jgi:hypothetical protein
MLLNEGLKEERGIKEKNIWMDGWMDGWMDVKAVV